MHLISTFRQHLTLLTSPHHHHRQIGPLISTVRPSPSHILQLFRFLVWTHPKLNPRRQENPRLCKSRPILRTHEDASPASSLAVSDGLQASTPSRCTWKRTNPSRVCPSPAPLVVQSVSQDSMTAFDMKSQSMGRSANFRATTVGDSSRPKRPWVTINVRWHRGGTRWVNN